jgi:hypothetical protein
MAVSVLLILVLGKKIIITLALVVMWPESLETCSGAKEVALWLRLAHTVSTVASRIVSN